MQWLKDGKVLEESSHHKTSIINSKTFILSIAAARVEDVGQYTAKASNKTGETSVTFALNVFTEADV